MPKQEIWRFTDEDDGEVTLDYALSDYVNAWENIDKSPVLTLEEIADFADREAEGRNNGTYVGAHRILAALLHRKLGREQATEIMREIAEYGGLDGMNGVGGESAAFADFGIKDDGKEWKLDETN